MQDNEKKPALRFKGFTDPWEQRKLDEAFDFTVPNNTLSRAELNQESGSVRNVHYGDVLIKYGSVLDAQNDELPFITGRSKDDFKGALLQNGDIIIADTAEDETTGKVCEIVNIQDKDVVAGLHTMVCRPKNKTAEGYFGYYMNSSSYHHQLLPLMQGIKVLSLSKTNVQKTTVKYPKDKAEQQKIADCLRRIDTLITLHQRKYEKLVNIKKSMLYKMFPKNGASVPEIRFKGFTDLWEQRKISELAEKTYGGGTPTTSNEAFWNGNIPWIQSSDIVDGKLMGVEPRKYITQTGLNNSATQLVPKDSIAIITRVGVGKLAYMPFSYSTSQDFLSLSKLNTEPFFTVYACYKKLQSELNTVQGTSIKGITKDELLAKTISVPVYSEQKQIGSFFTQLDTLITLHQRKLEKLQNIKKSCLEKMFV